MIIINTTEELIKHKNKIEHLYDCYGKIFSQSYPSIYSCFEKNKKKDRLVLIDESKDVLVCFKRREGKVLKSLFSGFPYLGKKAVDFENLLKVALNITNADCLYFPLIYESTEIIKSLSLINNITVWNRLPSPIVVGDFSIEAILKRVNNRYGKRTTRQKSIFEKKLMIKSVMKKDSTRVLSEVERNSWKYRSNQDMFSRGYQFDYYNKLINCGVVNLVAAYDLNKPVAFRIDALVKNTLYVVKWSFDESYKKYSPGFYLLVFDLFERYKNIEIDYIDLFGSPDLLKDVIENDRLERFDFCYSTNEELVRNIKNERLNFDSRVYNNYLNKKSIRRVYEQ